MNPEALRKYREKRTKVYIVMVEYKLFDHSNTHSFVFKSEESALRELRYQSEEAKKKLGEFLLNFVNIDDEKEDEFHIVMEGYEDILKFDIYIEESFLQD